MTVYQRILTILILCLEAVLLYRMLKEKIFPLRRFFFFYILTMFLSSLFILFFYEWMINTRLYGQGYYIYFFAFKDILHNLLKLGIIYVLYEKIYRPYQGARPMIRTLLFLTTPFFFYNLLTLRSDPQNSLIWNIVYRFDSWVVIWLALMFIILAGGVFFFNLKIDRRLKYILLGFLAYQAPRAIVKILADIIPPDYHHYFSHINQLLILPPLIIWILAFSCTAEIESPAGSDEPAG